MKPCSLLFFGLSLSALNSYSQDKPNILWLTSEDHGPQLGCYGDSNANTPTADKLASKGMRFNFAWSTYPCCAPARTAIISGMYPGSTGGEHMRSMVAMPAGKKMFPQFLREAGYYCTNNQKEDYNLRKPDGVWDNSSRDGHWLSRSDGQPFFAVFNSQKSHEFQIYRQPHVQKLDPARVRVPAYNPDTPEIRKDWAQYYDVISEADADAGVRLKELEEAGLIDETIIFYYADHGSGMPRCKRWPSNSGLRMPLIVYFPEKWRHLAPKEYQPGGNSDRLVDFVDLAPTMLSIAGIEPPEWMEGHAFAGSFQTRPKSHLYGGRGRMDEVPDLVRTVTDGRFVYIRNYMPHLSQAQFVGTQFLIPTTQVWYQLYLEGKLNQEQSIFWTAPKAPEELFDLQNDPDEVNNLCDSPQHQEILRKFRNLNREHIMNIRDIGFMPEVEIHLRSKGSSPYDIAKDDAKYPFQRIFETAELASNLKPDVYPVLKKMLKDNDGVVRYWATMGYLMRGNKAYQNGKKFLRQLLNDTSPNVRIVAAQTLVMHGSKADQNRGLAVLEELAPTGRNGILVSWAALTALADLGDKAAPLYEMVKNIEPAGFSPDERYDKYIGTRVIPRILNNLGK